MAPTVEIYTFVRIKRPIKSQQTYNQSSCLIILRLFVFERVDLGGIFAFRAKIQKNKPNINRFFKWQSYGHWPLLLNFQCVQLNGMLLKSYRNQHVKLPSKMKEIIASKSLDESYEFVKEIVF